MGEKRPGPRPPAFPSNTLLYMYPLEEGRGKKRGKRKRKKKDSACPFSWTATYRQGKKKRKKGKKKSRQLDLTVCPHPTLRGPNPIIPSSLTEENRPSSRSNAHFYRKKKGTSKTKEGKGEKPLEKKKKERRPHKQEPIVITTHISLFFCLFVCLHIDSNPTAIIRHLRHDISQLTRMTSHRNRNPQRRRRRRQQRLERRRRRRRRRRR